MLTLFQAAQFIRSANPMQSCVTHMHNNDAVARINAIKFNIEFIILLMF